MTITREQQKWILCEDRMPREGQEIAVVANEDGEFTVWFGKYKAGKFMVTAFDDYCDDACIYELAMKPICWKPQDECPFADLQDDNS